MKYKLLPLLYNTTEYFRLKPFKKSAKLINKLKSVLSIVARIKKDSLA